MATALDRRIDSIRLENLLSFKCAELELRNLNVLIGPNGSGKSNLLTALEILRGTRSDFYRTVRELGGIELQRGGLHGAPTCRVRIKSRLDETGPLQYEIQFEPGTGIVSHEHFGYDIQSEAGDYLLLREQSRVHAVESALDARPLPKELIRGLQPKSAKPSDSVLFQIIDAERYYSLTLFGDVLQTLRIVPPISFGRMSSARGPSRVLEDETRLLDNSSNLALVLNNLVSSGLHAKIDNILPRFLSGYQRLAFRIEGGTIRMFVSEKGLNDPVPASRLSDGTIAFLRLVALIYEPATPMILAIEEPEAGLHPDAVRLVAEMLQDASARKQILVTTHSPELVDALSHDPEAVVICEKNEENGTQFRRLSSQDMAAWLKHYTLGELWTKGEIGGNRW